MVPQSLASRTQTSLAATQERYLARQLIVRIVFFGTGSDYSIIVLEQLIRHANVGGVVLPTATGARGRTLKKLFLRYASRRIRRIARSGGLPVLEYSSAGTIADALRSLGPDLIVVASFPARLPSAICAVATVGAINVHPSLLPAHRGADPLFWSYFEDDQTTGVTVHWLDDHLDTGDIIVQENLVVPRGSTALSLAATIAHAGARLLLTQLPSLADGTAPRKPQEEGTTDPLPSRAGWVVDWNCWPAERVWHFLRGVGAAHGHRLVDRHGRSTPAGEAISWEPAVPDAPPGTVETMRRGVRISCIDGFVIARHPPLLLRVVRHGSPLLRLLRRGRR